jgi:hypothetical protein
LPPLHAWLEQTEPPFCHVPFGRQTCGCWPLHCSAPGMQATHALSWHIGVCPLQAEPSGCHLPP